MADITGSYRRADRPIVYFEAKQDGERWTCLAKVGGERFEQTTFQPSPWPCIEKVVGQALDSTTRDVEPPRYDMNRKLAKPATKPSPLRRRGNVRPTDLPQWTPPET
jgi:hypothetical protein